eukprot:12044045-Alexandrium_andersonii.AAC.1
MDSRTRKRSYLLQRWCSNEPFEKRPACSSFPISRMPGSGPWHPQLAGLASQGQGQQECVSSCKE